MKHGWDPTTFENDLIQGRTQGQFETNHGNGIELLVFTPSELDFND